MPKKTTIKLATIIFICLNLSLLLFYSRDLVNFFLADFSLANNEEESSPVWEEIKTNTNYTGDCEPVSTYNDLSFSDAKEAYHTFINCLFDEKMIQIEETISDPSELSLPGDEATGLPHAPIDTEQTMREMLDNTVIANLNQENGQDRIVGFGITALEEYARYAAYLDELILDPVRYRQQDPSPPLQMQDDFVAAQMDLVTELEAEKEKALRALDIALNAFNEMRVAYPLHLRFEKIIEHLQLYRNQFKRLRTLVDCVPDRFKKPRTSKGI